METVFEHKRISAVLNILPENKYSFFDEIQGGKTKRNERIAENMGYGARYRAKKKSVPSEFCVAGLKHLLENGVINKEQIGAIIVVTFSPDYYMPNVSHLVHKEFDLPSDVLLMDITDGCSGYLLGLIQAFMLLDHMKEKKVLLFTADVVNRKREKSHHSMRKRPQFGGDSSSVTVIENTTNEGRITINIQNDGSKSNLIMFDQGAFSDTFHQNKAGRENVLEDPTASFHFFQEGVPNSVEKAIRCHGIKKEDVDYFFFIQANKLSARKFADKLEIPYEKVPMDIVERFGDTSSSVNPIEIVDTLKEIIKDRDYTVVLSGYGAGLRYGSAVLKIEKDTYLDWLKTEL